MKRYSLLWGTTLTTEYRYLWTSSGIAGFFNNLNLPNTDKAAETALNCLRAFPNYPEAGNQPSDEKPITLHYAPMHLYKLPAFPPSAKPFCALASTGAEEYKRGTTYTYLTLFSRELMLGNDPKFNYLDVLFGTHMATARDVEKVRVAKNTAMLDLEPEKVTPVFEDLKTAIYTAGAILEGNGERRVIIKLEPDCGFNRRAKELLKQIYSLLPPSIAIETGFATYFPTQEIEEHSKKNSVLVYVVPASANTSGFQMEKTIVLDLGDPNYQAPLQESQMEQVLYEWSQLSWDVRYSGFLSLFADVQITFQNNDIFLQKSEEFFDNIREFKAWMQNSEYKGSIKSLSDLEKLFQEHPLWLKNPTIKQQIQSRLDGYLLPSGCTLSMLLGESIASCKFMTDKAESKTEYGRYLLGKMFGDVDIPDVCNRVAAKQAETSAASATAELVAVKTTHEAEMQRKNEEISKQDSLHRSKLKQMQELHMQQLRDAEQKCEKLDADLAIELQNRRNTEAMLYEANKKLEALRESEAKAMQIAARAKEDSEQYRVRCQTAEESLQISEEKRRHLESQVSYGSREYGDNRPKFARNTPWWFLGVAGVIIGALLCGAVWFTVSLLGSDADAPTVESTSESTETTIGTTEPSSIITSTSEEESSSEEVPSESETAIETSSEALPFTFENDWENEQTAEWLKQQVPEMQTIRTSDIQGYCPIEWEADTPKILAVFSIDVANEVIENADLEQGDELTVEPEPTNRHEFLNYAVLVHGDVSESVIGTVAEAELVLRYGELFLVSYGDSVMTDASLQAFAVMTDNLSFTETDNMSTNMQRNIFIRIDDETLLDISELFTSNDWLKDIVEISKDEYRLQLAQQELNTSMVPVVIIEMQENVAYLYDYRLEPSKIDDLERQLGNDGISIVKLQDFAAIVQ